MQYNHDPNFQTLLIVPSYPDNRKMMSSRTFRVATWEDLRDRPGSYAGIRFNQIIATDAPCVEWQHRVWHEMQSRAASGCIMHIL